MAPPSSEAVERLSRLMSYLAADRDNVTLLSDAADAALAARDFAQAQDLLAHRAALAPPGSRERAMSGMLAMAQGDFAGAAEIFSALHAETPNDPALRFNLAWSLAMTKNFDAALDLLDEPTTSALGQAAMLEIQLLHEAQRLEDAIAHAKRHLIAHPQHSGLLAAVSVLAIDSEDNVLAKTCASGAGDHPDAQTTLGVLALADDDDAAAARAYFDSALLRAPASPRALIGRGLTRLLIGESAEGATDIEQGAAIFGDHIGSWIAAGWARLLAKDHKSARAHFERAVEIDPTFAESQGSLGVIAALEGDIESAERLARTALRLDRKSFSGAFALAIVTQAKGDQGAARAIVERALNTPIDASGKTVAQSLAKYGLFA